MKLCVTGGGTGGHLMVAQAIAHAAKARGDEVIFIGSTTGQDQKYFANSNDFDAVYFLPTTGVVNQKGFAKLIALYKVFKAFLAARKILQKHTIDATYSVGGFSAAPAAIATLTRKIPLFIHEQNAVAGKLNRLLRRYAVSFVSAYEEHSPISGYPVQGVFASTAHQREKLQTLIFLGGSQGAKAINDLALRVAPLLQEKGIKIIHQTGERDYERVAQAYEKLGIEVELYSFTNKMPQLISQADMAVSRAGASTLWELTTNGCPAFYIPYPYAAGDHQYHNAKFIVDHEMGWCHREDATLQEALVEALNDPQLATKSQKLLAFANIDVAQKMVEGVAKVVEKNKTKEKQDA